MYKTLLVARQEFLTNVRKRSFLIAAFGVPLLTIIMMGVVIFVTASAEGNLDRFSAVGVVDDAGIIILADDPTATYEEPPVPAFYVYPTEEAARNAMDMGVVGAYFVLPETYMTTGRLRLITASGASEALTDNIEDYLRRNVGTGVDPAVMDRILEPTNASIRFLSTGRTVPMEATVGLLLLPIIFVTIFMIAAQTTSGYLMSGVVEEKSNRIMEILITTIKPIQLLAGKIIGLGLLGLIQLLIWAVLSGITGAIAQGTGSAFLSAIVITPDMAALALIYFFLGYFFLSTMMAGIGAVVGSEQESRQTAGIFGLLMWVPFFALFTFLTDPNGTIPTVLSLIPVTAPTAMILRATFTSVPTEQIVLSIVLLIVLNLFVLWLSARIFRFALLMRGNRFGLRQIIRLIRRRGSAGAIVSPAGEGSAS